MIGAKILFHPSRNGVGATLGFIVMGLAAVLISCSSTAKGNDPPQGSVSDTECELMTPSGLMPADWFAADGSSPLSEDEAGAIALVMGARANFDPKDEGSRKVSDVLARIAAGDPVAPLTDDQIAALATLDDEVANDCG